MKRITAWVLILMMMACGLGIAGAQNAEPPAMPAGGQNGDAPTMPAGQPPAGDFDTDNYGMSAGYLCTWNIFAGTLKKQTMETN